MSQYRIRSGCCDAVDRVSDLLDGRLKEYESPFSLWPWFLPRIRRNWSLN
jgi:hypothetical protein